MFCLRRFTLLASGLLLVLGPSLASAAPPTQQTSFIRYGETKQSRLNIGGSEQTWQFSGHPNDLVLVDMRAIDSGTLDTYLTLADTQGHLLAEDDDNGYGTNSRIGPLRVSQSGDYSITASAYSGGGEYTLQLINLNTAPALKTGKPLVGSVNSDTPANHFLLTTDAESETLFRLRVTDDERYANPIVSLYSLTGLLATSEGMEDSLIDPLLIAPNTPYAVIVDWDSTSRGGPYELWLDASTTVLLEDGIEQTGELTYTQYAQQHYFQAETGETLRLTLRVTEGNIVPMLDIYTSDYSLYLFSAIGETMREVSVVIHMPSSGIFVVEISDDILEGESGSYSVVLSREGPQTQQSK